MPKLEQGIEYIITAEDFTEAAMKAVAERIDDIKPKSIVIDVDDRTSKAIEKITEKIASFQPKTVDVSIRENKEVNEHKTLTEEQIKAVKNTDSGLRLHRDWRTAKDLSVDQEAVRRVALAKEEETAAQKALAETAKSTAQAAASLAEIEKVITQEG